MEINIPRWSDTFKLKMSLKRESGHGVFYFLGDKQEKKFKAIIEEQALSYQREALLKSERETIHFVGQNGLVWIQRRTTKKIDQHQGLFNQSLYSLARDGAGALVGVLRAQKIKKLDIEFWGAAEEEQIGFIVGFEMGAYQFRNLNENQNMLEGLPEVCLLSQGQSFSKEILKKAQSMGHSINLARHLVNLPGNDLNPQSFAHFAQTYFKGSKQVKVNVWNAARLKKEKMGLHLAVGQGALHEPCMIHLSYRPRNSSKKQPIAFVGKGVTFDTGGLDIKPSTGMRLMKKDMGGAATVIALCAWIDEVGLPIPCDFYLGVAENAVGPKSFRPGDIFKARNGLTVEIHNTDAEGRLVLADVLDVAVKAKDKPKLVIDVATLTGVIKMALGADIPGVFSNNDSLANDLLTASQASGEVCWRMPLVPKYAANMNSYVAQLTNAVDGFGGAITAALFLEKFVDGIPWAHIDIYAWNDRPNAGLSMVGGSGQGVQLLAQYLMNKV